jgi:hypothetical protein
MQYHHPFVPLYFFSLGETCTPVGSKRRWASVRTAKRWWIHSLTGIFFLIVQQVGLLEGC